MAKGKPPSGKTPPPANDAAILDADTKRAQRRIAKTRDKLTKALEDPEMRKQMVAAIRKMMHQEK